MVRLLFIQFVFFTSSAFAQNYTIIALPHTENKISEVHPFNGQVLREYVLPTEGDPWFGESHEGVISPDSKIAYVTFPYSMMVMVFDLDTFEPIEELHTEFFERPPQVRNFARGVRKEVTSADPHGIALSPDGRKLYITAGYAEVPGLVVYDTVEKTFKKIDTVIAGNHVAVHQQNSKVYFPTRDRHVIVIDGETDEIIKVIQLPAGSRPTGVSFGGPNGEVWVNGDGDGSITVIDTHTDEVIKTMMPRSSGGGRTATSPDGRWAASTHGLDVSIIDTTTQEIIAARRLTTNDSEHGFPLFSPDSNVLHVMNEMSDDIVSFDMRTLEETGIRTYVGDTVFGGGIRILD